MFGFGTIALVILGLIILTVVAIILAMAFRTVIAINLNEYAAYDKGRNPLHLAKGKST